MLQKIKLNNGKIREVQDHLAFDPSLQIQQGFVPCDDNGVPLAASELEKKTSSSEPAAQAVADVKGGATMVESDLSTNWIEQHAAGKSYAEIAKDSGVHWKKVESVVKASKKQTA